MSGFETWDHGTGVYVTYYLILLVCVICACTALWCRVGSSMYFAPCQQFVASCIFVGMAAGTAGCAHQLVDNYYWDGHRPSRSWDNDHEQLFWWAYFFAQVSYPLASVALMALCLAVVGAQPFGAPSVYAVGACASTYAAYLVMNAEIYEAAQFGMLFHFAVLVGSIVIVGIGGVLNGRGAKRGKLWILLALTIQVIVALLVVFSPEACSQGPEARHAGCPYGEDFNEAVVCNLILILSICILCWGVVEADWSEAEERAWLALSKTIPADSAGSSWLPGSFL